MRRLTSVDLLHLDDLGAEKSTDWVLETLYTIVNQRYQEQRSVIITTNFDHDKLKEQVGERIVSRLADMCGEFVVPLFGSDMRGVL